MPPPAPTRAQVGLAVTDSRIELAALQGYVDRLDEVPGRWAHPTLGDFSATQWLCFLAIHTEHHLAIMRDVEAALTPSG